MQCEQFEQILEQQQEDGRLPKPALDHIDVCDTCRALTADLDAINGLAVELGAEGIAPPERVWVALRNRLEAEQLIHDPRHALRPAALSLPSAWWTAFQRPALAGGFLSLMLVVAGLASFQGGAEQMAGQPQFALQESSPVLSANTVFRQEMLSVGSDETTGVQMKDTAVRDSIRRNLNVVDNFIAMCEKSVREQPENEIAREYLYGAYEQKAELLATATNRSVAGGLQ